VKRTGRVVCGLMVACGLLLGLGGCGGGKPTVADEPVRPRKRDPRATPDDPRAEAVKPPAPPEGEAATDLSGLTPVERDAIAALKKNAGQQEPPPPPVTPQAEPRTAVPKTAAPAPVPVLAGGKVAGLGPWIEPTGAIPAAPARAKKAKVDYSLADARKEKKSRLTEQFKANEDVDVPPPGVFDLVKYKSPAGALAAYVSPDPKDGTKRPAIVWITGGDCNTIGNVWDEIDPENEQSASAYRAAGIVMMFPSLRGGNRNPGVQEGFLGEVDDVIAAGEYVAKLPYVDPNRIYLGGHSSGGTMALLTAELTTRFRAVFSFGPVGNMAGYRGGQVTLPFNTADKEELAIRSPGAFLESIERPTFVIEGTKGNYRELMVMQKLNTNPLVTILGVQGGDHFEILHPINTLIAQKIRTDKTPETNITLTAAELQRAMGRP